MGRRAVWLGLVTWALAGLTGASATAQAPAARGAIRIAVVRSGGELPGPGSGFVPLSGLRVVPQAGGGSGYGPLTVPEHATHTIPDVAAGKHTARDGKLFKTTCPAVTLAVAPGKTTTVTYDQAPQEGGGPVPPCKVSVTGPA